MSRIPERKRELPTKIRLEQYGDWLQLSGVDGDGRPFMVVLDRLVAANLALDIEKWLAG